MRTTVVMRSTATSDAAPLPESVIGPGFGARPGTIRMNVLVYAPLGGAVPSLRFNGKPLDFASLEHDGPRNRPVASVPGDTEATEPSPD